MKKPNLSKIIQEVKGVLKKHSPEILTGMGIAGMVTTVVMAIKATPKAIMLVHEKRNQDKDYKELTPMETVKVTWKCYIPTAASCLLSAGCLIAANSVNVRRNAALATAYTLSESALREYQAKVVETFGEKKEQAVHDAIAKDKMDKNPVNNREVFLTEKGNTLCYDGYSGRYFKSDIDKIKRAENEINRRLISEVYISLNEFYDELGLTGIKLGDDLGWDIGKGFLEIRFSSHLAEEGVPCIVIDYNLIPLCNS